MCRAGWFVSAKSSQAYPKAGRLQGLDYQRVRIHPASKLVNLHSIALLLSELVVYAYMDLWPLATYTKQPLGSDIGVHTPIDSEARERSNLTRRIAGPLPAYDRAQDLAKLAEPYLEGSTLFERV
ncbi:hypothetical protein FA13DRAFT_56133 [Coprinellus micaceus]|uniref:Uncharacterized protein n=1 Tax=Coprinellus micaceus TaxID=71717 RepID=A0A4Y7U1L4_COPMI|nr:hypothetical protein FA13DRAFT_56133 [Coprinellus micaceus]